MFRRLTDRDVWNVASSIPAADGASIGKSMADDDRLNEAADKEVLRERRRQNLQNWRADVAAAERAGFTQLRYEAPLEFDALTAYNVPRVRPPQHPMQSTTQPGPYRHHGRAF